MTPPALEVRKLRKVFGDLVAVDGVSFTLERGQLLGLLGPNGAGKTTTVSMIAGLVTGQWRDGPYPLCRRLTGRLHPHEPDARPGRGLSHNSPWAARGLSGALGIMAYRRAVTFASPQPTRRRSLLVEPAREERGRTR